MTRVWRRPISEPTARLRLLREDDKLDFELKC